MLWKSSKSGRRIPTFSESETGTNTRVAESIFNSVLTFLLKVQSARACSPAPTQGGATCCQTQARRVQALSGWPLPGGPSASLFLTRCVPLPWTMLLSSLGQDRAGLNRPSPTPSTQQGEVRNGISSSCRKPPGVVVPKELNVPSKETALLPPRSLQPLRGSDGWRFGGRLCNFGHWGLWRSPL